MRFDAEKIVIRAGDGPQTRAKAIFEDALFQRTGVKTGTAPSRDGECVFSLLCDPSIPCPDTFVIENTGNGFLFRAASLRGLIFAVGLFLRKTQFEDKTVVLTEDISGVHTPEKKIRGHQLGCRPISNTYDQWDTADFERYFIELMFFGMNTVELIPFAEQNVLMRYDSVTMTALLSEKAKALELDVSLWIPNTNESEEAELREREALFKAVPYIDAVFIPGSDPGELPADTLIDRCVKIKNILKKYHPNAALWPSAQKPHDDKNWGEVFIKAVNENKACFGGVIQGPNRAFTTKELREKLSQDLPIRFYPDICHTLRCEHPVENTSYVFSTAFGRESICPRPADMKALHASVFPYTAGSVTYSDGVNDDVNKAVWCALEWDPSLSERQIIEDYVRLYLFGRDLETLTNGILSVEINRHRHILDSELDTAASLLRPGKDETNWRALSLSFVSLCASYLKKKYLEDRDVIEKAAVSPDRAKEILSRAYSGELRRCRAEIERLAALLYHTAGMQLGTERYSAHTWERGATLDTLDLPITDRARLLHVARTRPELLKKELTRNETGEDEFYFSFALSGMKALNAEQTPDYYIDFQGDRPQVNDGTLPTCLFSLFDHFSLRAKIEGLSDRDYILRVTYKDLPEHFYAGHKVTANGHTVKTFSLDRKYTDEMLPGGFIALRYFVPKEYLENGRLFLEISEEKTGFKTAEFSVLHS